MTKSFLFLYLFQLWFLCIWNAHACRWQKKIKKCKNISSVISFFLLLFLFNFVFNVQKGTSREFNWRQMHERWMKEVKSIFVCEFSWRCAYCSTLNKYCFHCSFFCFCLKLIIKFDRSELKHRYAIVNR